jgi:hypothetical protein
MLSLTNPPVFVNCDGICLVDGPRLLFPSLMWTPRFGERGVETLGTQSESTATESSTTALVVIGGGLPAGAGWLTPN